MASLSMKLIGGWLRLTAKPRMSSAERARRTMHEPKTSAPPPAKLTERHAVTVRTVEGHDCWTVAPREPASRAALYLHGGAYIAGMSPQHWTLIGALADAGVHVEVPLYGLAPDHTFEAAYTLTAAVHDALLEQFDAADIALAGDSAGAGLALGFAQTLSGTGRPQPGRIALVAPWLDLSLGNPDVPEVERRDPWLTSAGLREAGRAWAGDHDAADPRLSPIKGSFAGLAPIRVWIGTRDLFLPDALLLRDTAAAAGVACTLTVAEGAVHVYPLVPAPEGRTALRQVVAFVAE